MTPKYKAKKYGTEDFIESETIIESGNGELEMMGEYYDETYRIDPETLLISLDGFAWFSMEDARLAFGEYMKTHGYEGED